MFHSTGRWYLCRFSRHVFFFGIAFYPEAKMVDRFLGNPIQTERFQQYHIIRFMYVQTLSPKGTRTMSTGLLLELLDRTFDQRLVSRMVVSTLLAKGTFPVSDSEFADSGVYNNLILTGVHCLTH
jgi:hypothetical protein